MFHAKRGLKTILLLAVIVICSMSRGNAGADKIQDMIDRKIGEVNRKPIEPKKIERPQNSGPMSRDQSDEITDDNYYESPSKRTSPKKINKVIAIGESSVRFPSGVKIDYVIRFLTQSPKEKSTVTIHYEGYFAKPDERGEIEPYELFVSTKERGKVKPSSFIVTDGIKCWQQALLHMNLGSKARVRCPADTAYGATPPPGIPKNQDLVFDIELLKIN